MKKKILLLCFAFFGLFTLQAQYTFLVGGYVTNSNGGAAIANHTVYLMSDSINSIMYYGTANTNSNGYYSITLTTVLPAGTPVNFYVYTYDCNGLIQTTTLTNANPQNVVNFSICNSTASGCNALFNHFQNSSNAVNFQDLSTGTPVSWLWSFGDGTSSTLQNPTHTYNAVGSFVICLTITTASNCTSTHCDSVYIQTVPTNTCSAYFLYHSDSLLGPNTIHFQGNSSTTYLNSQIVYSWNFGDGTTSTLQNPTHTFTSTNPAGGYNVCLTIQVLNSAASILCSYTDCNFVVVGSVNNGCQNSFTYSYQNLTYSFTGTISSSNPTTYYWVFGDGITATGQYVTHTFAQPAAGSTGYHVCLYTVTTSSLGASCTDTSCQFVPINNTSGNVIQGYVYTGNYPATDGYVLLYQANNAAMSYALVDTLALDSLGYFYYNYLNVPPTNPAYLIKAVLNSTATNYSQYAPTFYHNTINWYTATPVFPSATTVFYYINMIHLPTPVIGNGSIGGNVFQNGIKSSGENPLSGVELILTDANDAPLKINYSATNGSFSFPSLPMGNYKLHVEIAGVNYTPFAFTLSNTNPGINNISVIISSTGAIITGIENDLKDVVSVSEIYPNPAATEAFLELNSLKSDKVVVFIYDQTGMKLSANEYKINGSQRINLNQLHLSSGIYTVKVQTSNGMNSVRKFVITK